MLNQTLGFCFWFGNWAHNIFILLKSSRYIIKINRNNNPFSWRLIPVVNRVCIGGMFAVFDIFLLAAVRLVGKPGSSMNKFAGRIEVFYNSGTGGRWGTVCDGGGYPKTFDIKAATVVCKELGYEGAEMVVPCCDVFGKGTGRIWMDNVKCVGTEPSITMCLHSGWGNTYCSHDYDVSVICKTNQTDRNAGGNFCYLFKGYKL